MHSAQGVTADTTHAVLGETTTPALLYVAITRGRESNQAYLYERRAGETEHEYAEAPGVHAMRRGTSHDASQLVRAIIATRDQQPRTAHDIAAGTDRSNCPSGCAACSTGAPTQCTPAAPPIAAGRTRLSTSC